MFSAAAAATCDRPRASMSRTISAASRTLTSSSSASGSPRSANTFPELGSTRGTLFRILAIPCLVVRTRDFQSLSNELNIRARCLYTEHVDGVFERDRVNGFDLQNTRPQAFPMFCCRMPPSPLRNTQRHTHRAHDRLRQRHQVLLR